MKLLICLFSILYFLIINRCLCLTESNAFYKTVLKVKESKAKKKTTKFDNKVVGTIKKKIDYSLENSLNGTNAISNLDNQGKKDYNLKNNTYVKLWLSDIEIRYGGSYLPLGDNFNIKEHSTLEEEDRDEIEINKIIEENKLMDRLKMLRQQEKEISNLGDVSNIDDNTKKRIYSSGIRINLVDNEPETKEENVSNPSLDESTILYDYEDIDEIPRMSQGQQLAAMSILSGEDLIQNIELLIDAEDPVNRAHKLVEVSLGSEYDRRTFLECIEMKKNLKQKIGLLKLEIAKLNTSAQKLKNKEGRTKEYRNILDNIEKNNEALNNKNIELLKIDKRIKQLSLEENLENQENIFNSENKAEVLDEDTAEVIQVKKKRKELIRNAILKEARRRIEENKKLQVSIGRNETEGSKSGLNLAYISKSAAEAEKESEKEIQNVPNEGEESLEKLQEFTELAKMLVWLQEKDLKNPASSETRKIRGKAAIESLEKLHTSSMTEYKRIAERIRKKFERAVYEGREIETNNVASQDSQITSSG